MEVCPRIREVCTAASGPTSPSPPTMADAPLEDTWNRSCGEYPAKKMAAEEVPDKVQQADADRYRAYSKIESTEKELRDWMMDYPGPRSIVTEQCLNPVITVKMQPSHTERSGRLKSFQSRARMLKDAKGGAAPAYNKDQSSIGEGREAPCDKKPAEGVTSRIMRQEKGADSRSTPSMIS